eukprot:gb/GECH01001615.1/.p1 GENE.gb/GECH01001615.1/~~gb/GECH01001615.1/.p1  ORF type:complete len:163 (+),score=31.10 gb/GECH01001615.1/:1-489(+)
MPRYTHVRYQTSMGDIEIELYYNHAPKSCENIAGLAERGYYNGVIFHRVIKDFMIQTGDPTGTGRGGDSLWGGAFKDEITSELKHVGAGIVSMANSGPNTNRSQFFITLAPTPWLDGRHTILGRVSSGMSVVKRIGLVPVDASENNRPVEQVIIKTATPLEQ